jgi:predicted DNA-binding ribbon-helix-helix protein
MTQRPQKRSITLHGHRTSVSLEDEFWSAFCEIAAAQGLSINALAAQIDEGRILKSGLAGAIRIFVLRHYKAQLAQDVEHDLARDV